MWEYDFCSTGQRYVGLYCSVLHIDMPCTLRQYALDKLSYYSYIFLINGYLGQKL